MYCVVLIVRYVAFLVLVLLVLFDGFLPILHFWQSLSFMSRSVVVSAGLLRVFGREVAELPIVATSREHQGKVCILGFKICSSI